MEELLTNDATRVDSESESTQWGSSIAPESGGLSGQNAWLERVSGYPQIKGVLPSFNWEEFLKEWAVIACGLPFIIPEELKQSDLDLTSRIEAVLSYLQSNQIVVPDPVQVLGYLSSYLELAGNLPFICMLAKKEFQDNSQLSLEVYTDPEIEDTHLCLYVRQEDHEKGLMKKIMKVSRDSNELINNISGWIHITSDGRSPI